ncbi:MAG: phosphatidylserine decarboxylase, partial [Parachlamydiaceae bacterium]
DESEFLPATFNSFNDFFIRKLKKEARPISSSDFVCPADARYRFFQNVKSSDGFYVKGQKFDLYSLIGNKELAERFIDGSMMIARLCPFDYHRFHFSHDAIPSASELINGYLYSVNPIALKKDISIFTQNKRRLTLCRSDKGISLYIEIGATNVGSIVETYTPELPVKKGDEKGYFEFGASSLILLFEPDMIAFDSDLIELSKGDREIRCLMGQSMGNFRVR